RLLRSVARLRHMVWVMALLLAVALPFLSSISSLKHDSAPPVTRTEALQEAALVIPANITEGALTSTPAARSGFRLRPRAAAILISFYLLLIMYRSARLFGAWLRTRRARGDAKVFELNADVQGVVDRCRQAFGGMRWRVLTSRSLRAPVTVGVL